MAKKRKSKNLPARIDERKERFLENLGIYRNPVDAARKAGYSESYAIKIKSKMRKDPKLMDEVTRRYGVDAAVMRLPALQAIRDEVYNMVMEDPAKEKDYKHVFKTDLQIAGVLSSEQSQTPVTIQIGSLRHLMMELGQQRRRRITDGENVQDAETIEDEED